MVESCSPEGRQSKVTTSFCRCARKANGCQIQAELEVPTSDIDIGDKTGRVHARRRKWTTSAVVHGLLFPSFNYVASA